MSSNRDDMPRDEVLSALYKEGAQVEPPPALDAIILAAARRQAATPLSRPTERRPVPWWRTWLAPAGAVATIVLALSVTLSIEREQGGALPTAAPFPVAKPTAEPTVGADDLSVRAAETSARPEALERMKNSTRVMVDGDAQRFSALVAKPAASPAPAQRPSASAAATAIQPDMLESAAAPAAPAASAARAAPAAREERIMREIETKPPERWLDEIRRLKAAGLDVHASEQLELFRRSHPDYPLPADLRPEK